MYIHTYNTYMPTGAPRQPLRGEHDLREPGIVVLILERNHA